MAILFVQFREIKALADSVDLFSLLFSQKDTYADQDVDNYFSEKNT